MIGTLKLLYQRSTALFRPPFEPSLHYHRRNDCRIEYGRHAKYFAAVLASKLEMTEHKILNVSETIEECFRTHEASSAVVLKVSSKNKDYIKLETLMVIKMAIIHIKNILDLEHKTHLQDT